MAVNVPITCTDEAMDGTIRTSEVHTARAGVRKLFFINSTDDILDSHLSIGWGAADIPVVTPKGKFTICLCAIADDDLDVSISVELPEDFLGRYPLVVTSFGVSPYAEGVDLQLRESDDDIRIWTQSWDGPNEPIEMTMNRLRTLPEYWCFLLFTRNKEGMLKFCPTNQGLYHLDPDKHIVSCACTTPLFMSDWIFNYGCTAKDLRKAARRDFRSPEDVAADAAVAQMGAMHL